jgi:hypothetical protein
VHPSRQIVARSDIIAWKNIDTAHATEKDIFGGPSSHTRQIQKPGYRLAVIQIRERF